MAEHLKNRLSSIVLWEHTSLTISITMYRRETLTLKFEEKKKTFEEGI